VQAEREYVVSDAWSRWEGVKHKVFLIPYVGGPWAALLLQKAILVVESCGVLRLYDESRAAIPDDIDQVRPLPPSTRKSPPDVCSRARGVAQIDFLLDSVRMICYGTSHLGKTVHSVDISTQTPPPTIKCSVCRAPLHKSIMYCVRLEGGEVSLTCPIIGHSKTRWCCTRKGGGHLVNTTPAGWPSEKSTTCSVHYCSGTAKVTSTTASGPARTAGHMASELSAAAASILQRFRASQPGVACWKLIGGQWRWRVWSSGDQGGASSSIIVHAPANESNYRLASTRSRVDQFSRLRDEVCAAWLSGLVWPS
jgi:hypothetical protein